MTDAPRAASAGTRVQWIAIAVVAASAISILQLLPMEQLVGAMRGALEDLGFWGPVAFAIVYVAATVMLLPGSILTLAAGALFGPLAGTVTVSFGSVAGASLAFLIARYFARGRVVARLGEYPKFDAIDRAIGEGGWKIVGMLRLSPAIPFNLSNYLYGVTSIRFWPYVLTSWIAMAPATFMYVYFGYLAAAGVESAVASTDASTELARWTLRLVGLAATVGVTIYVTRLARRAIAEQTDIEAAGAAPPPDLAQEGAPAASGSRRRASILVAIACLAAATAGYARSHRDGIERYTESLLASGEQGKPDEAQP